MNNLIHNLTLIDLISEKHSQLRKFVEAEWDRKYQINITHTEWHLLAKVEQQHLKFSQVANILGISRQAVHKIVSRLIEKGVISSSYMGNNKRDKYLYLTPKGLGYNKKMHEIKAKIEESLIDKFGIEKIKDLRIVLLDNINKE